MYVPKTKDYVCEIGTFRMLQGVPFRVNILNKIVTANEADDTTMSMVYRIIEGYMYEFIPNGDSDVQEYIEDRAGRGYQERFTQMGLILDYDNWEYIIDAYTKTRDNAVNETELSGDDEQAKKNESSKPSKKASKEKIAS